MQRMNKCVAARAQAGRGGMRQVVCGSQTNAGTGAEAPVITTTADGVPSDPAAQSAAPPLQQAAMAAGGTAQVQHRLSGRLTP